MRYNAMERVQLGPGMLIGGLDLTAACDMERLCAIAESGASGEAHLLGFTQPGGCVRCEPDCTEEDAEAELLRWRVTLTGTLQNCGPEAFARLLGTVRVRQSGGCTVMTPGLIRSPEERPEPLCWVAETGNGVIGIQLRGAMSLGGVRFTCREKEAGSLAFRFSAVQEDEEEPCCSFVWIGGDGNDA